MCVHDMMPSPSPPPSGLWPAPGHDIEGLCVYEVNATGPAGILASSTGGGVSAAATGRRKLQETARPNSVAFLEASQCSPGQHVIQYPGWTFELLVPWSQALQDAIQFCSLPFSAAQCRTPARMALLDAFAADVRNALPMVRMPRGGDAADVHVWSVEECQDTATVSPYSGHICKGTPTAAASKARQLWLLVSFVVEARPELLGTSRGASYTQGGWGL